MKTRQLKPTFAVLLTCMSMGVGCEGKLGMNSTTEEVRPENQPADERPANTTGRPDDPVADDPCAVLDPGETPLRRLTHTEYHNSVRDLFPFASIPDQTLSADERVAGFKANTTLSVETLQAEEYQVAAESIASIVAAALPAELDMMSRDSVRQYLQDVGGQAFRRPLEPAEVDAYYAVYQLGVSEYDEQTGLEMMIEALLQSPTFLYRVEVGVDSDDAVVRLTQYEIATRLSYFLWGTGPDADLLAMAANGDLATTEQVEAQARVMMADARARERLNDVVTQWLRVDELNHVENPDPVFTNALRQSMVDEVRALIDDVIWEGDGRLQTLLTADYTFVDGRTAPLYGIAMRTNSVDAGLVRVDLPEDRQGILSLLGVLTTHGHGQAAIHRGRFIRDAFLCLSSQSPPIPDVLEELPTYEGESDRSKSDKRMANTSCSGCHLMMDPTGLAFDNYDSLGRYTTTDEHGNALHGTGEFSYTMTTDGPLDGAASVGAQLAGSPEVLGCMSVQFLRYATARTNQPSDACSIHVVDEALEAADGDVKEMMIALTTSDAFLYRRNLDQRGTR